MCEGLDDVFSTPAVDCDCDGGALKTYVDVPFEDDGVSDASLTDPDADRRSDKSRLASSKKDSVGYGTDERKEKWSKVGGGTETTSICSGAWSVLAGVVDAAVVVVDVPRGFDLVFFVVAGVVTAEAVAIRLLLVGEDVTSASVSISVSASISVCMDVSLLLAAARLLVLLALLAVLVLAMVAAATVC